MRLMAFILTGLLACSLSSYGTEKVVEPAALNSIVSFKVTKGPLLDGLKAIETQTGVRFSYFPEWFAKDMTLPDLEFSGSLKEGLDKVLDPSLFVWEPGEFGGVVVCKKGLKAPIHEDWIADHFKQSGVLIVSAGEETRGMGVKDGDVVLALDGESYTEPEELKYAAIIMKVDRLPTLSILRDGKEFEIKAKKRQDMFDVVGKSDTTYAPYPTLWDRYQKGGHQDPKWDALVRQLSDELLKSSTLRRPDRLIQLTRKCIDLGCRDPLVLVTAALITEEGCGAERWKRLFDALDPEQLQKAYGGSLCDARSRMLVPFGIQGGPALGEELDRKLEAAWAWHKSAPRTIWHRNLAYSVACRHFLRGEWAACFSVIDQYRDSYRLLGGFEQQYLAMQALQKLGRYNEAVEWQGKIYGTRMNGWSIITKETMVANAARFRLPAPQSADRLSGPAGLLNYKTGTVVNNMDTRARKLPSHALLPHNAIPEKGFLAEPIGELPANMELLFFVDLHQSYKSGSWVGIFLGSEMSKNRWHGLWRNTAFMVSGRMTLDRYYQVLGNGDRGGYHHSYALPGYTNDGTDVIRICKSAEEATVRCNGVWVTTDTAQSFDCAGLCQLGANDCFASLDCAAFVPTAQCYDNDLIRELSEKVITTKDMSLQEACEIWDRIARISPPKSIWRTQRHVLEKLLKAAPPKVAYEADAPALSELTIEQAKERLQKGGEVRWCLEDAADPDAVWCGHADGTISSLSRSKYWTTTYVQVREYAGPGVVLKNPVFDPDTVWLPSDRGLFAFDRKGGTFSRIPLGGLLQATEVLELKRDGDHLAVRAKVCGSEQTWVLNLATGAWAMKHQAAHVASENKTKEGVDAAAPKAPAPKQPEEAQRLLQSARNYARNKMVQPAVAALEKLLKEYPDSPTVDDAKRLLQELGKR